MDHDTFTDLDDEAFAALAATEPEADEPPPVDLSEVEPVVNGDQVEAETPELKLEYPDSIAFFEGFLRNVIERRVNTLGAGRGLRWDPDWRRHPEVVLRVEALWRAWEGARADNAMESMSLWWLNHLDPHLAKILDGENGPMAPDHFSEPIWPPLPTLTTRSVDRVPPPPSPPPTR